MNPEIKRQIQRNEHLIGVVVIVGLTLAMLLVAFHLYALFERPHVYDFSFATFQIKGQHYIGPAIAATVASFALAAVWFAFGSDSLLRRFAFVICFFAVGWSVWFLRAIDSKDEVVPIRASEMEPAIASSLLPVFCLVMVLPLVVTRGLFGCELISIWDPVKRSPQTGIKDYLLWTTMIAGVFVGMGIAASVFGDFQVMLETIAIPLAIVGGFSTIVLLPSAIVLFSQRIGLLLSSTLTLAGLLVVGLLICKTIPKFKGPEGFILVLGSCAVGGCVFLWGVLAIRLFGYRLKRPNRLFKSKESRPEAIIGRNDTL